MKPRPAPVIRHHHPEKPTPEALATLARVRALLLSK